MRTQFCIIILFISINIKSQIPNLNVDFNAKVCWYENFYSIDFKIPKSEFWENPNYYLPKKGKIILDGETKTLKIKTDGRIEIYNIIQEICNGKNGYIFAIYKLKCGRNNHVLFIDWRRGLFEIFEDKPNQRVLIEYYDLVKSTFALDFREKEVLELSEAEKKNIRMLDLKNRIKSSEFIDFRELTSDSLISEKDLKINIEKELLKELFDFLYPKDKFLSNNKVNHFKNEERFFKFYFDENGNILNIKYIDLYGSYKDLEANFVNKIRPFISLNKLPTVSIYDTNYYNIKVLCKLNLNIDELYNIINKKYLKIGKKGQITFYDINTSKKISDPLLFEIISQYKDVSSMGKGEYIMMWHSAKLVLTMKYFNNLEKNFIKHIDDFLDIKKVN